MRTLESKELSSVSGGVVHIAVIIAFHVARHAGRALSTYAVASYFGGKK